MKNLKFPVKIRENYKIEKKYCINIGVFVYKNKAQYPVYVSKDNFKRHVYILLIEKEVKRHSVLIKDFNPFTYNCTLYRGTNHFIVIIYKLLVQEKC